LLPGQRWPKEMKQIARTEARQAVVMLKIKNKNEMKKLS
jgi:hypothetical protein